MTVFASKWWSRGNGRPRWLEHLAPWLLGGALALLPACDRREERPAPGAVEAPEVPSVSASDWQESFRRGHDLADRARNSADRLEAARSLEQLFEMPSPSTLEAGEGIRLRQDAAARAGRLWLEEGDPKRALEWARRGLELTDDPSIFQANLFLLQADAQTQSGQHEASRTSLIRALEVNRQLMDRELEKPNEDGVRP